MTKEKTSRLNVRLTPEELAAVKARAADTGLATSEYVRRCALRDGNKPVSRIDAERLHAIYRNLRKAGGNLNQCARELNTHHRPSELEAQLCAALQAVADASEDVSAFMADARASV